nr:mechanosensitive ion channel domain-containing protein [uncultured Shimia sp.]
MIIRLLTTVFSLLIAIALAPSAHAQLPTSALSSGSSAETAEGFAEVMRQAADSGVSIIVLDTAGNVVGTSDASPPAPENADDDAHHMSALMKMQTKIGSFRQVLRQRLEALPAALNEVEFILRASSPSGEIFAFVKTALWTLFLLAIGIVVEREIYGKRLARNFVVPLIKENPKGYSQKLPFLVIRFIAGIIGIGVSILVAVLIGSTLFEATNDTAIEFTAFSVTAAYGLVRIVSLIWRMILSPYLEQYRVPAFTTPDAKRLHHWLFLLATFDICTMFFGIWLSELGLNYDVYAMMVLALSTLFAALNIAMIFFNKRAISTAILNRRPPEEVSFATRLASQLWAPVLIVYVLFGLAKLSSTLVFEEEMTIPFIAGAYIIFTSIIVVYATINYAIEKYFDRARTIREMNEAALAAAEAIEAGDEMSAEDVSQLESIVEDIDSRKMNTFEELARRISGILALVAGLIACLRVWGGERLMTEGAMAERLVDIVIIMFIGYIVFHVFRIWIDTKIRDEMGVMEEAEAELGDEGGANGASRLATLLPLFRNFILLVIVVTIILIVLMEFGVNVSPLFAGAGVVGLAIGFGAQSLVRDIFSGAFFLFDDAFRKGEYIDIGSVKGTVEKISVRSFQLRHHLGPLHTIPFGEIQFLTNYSRDWVIMKLPLRVTYDTDVEKVRKLIKNLGIELLDDPVIGDNFIQPLKSQGVIQMQDSAMIIRVKFMTKPGDQWLVRKKVFEEIRALFEREGIKFAHREVTVRLADEDSENLSPKQKEAVAGAVQAAIVEEELDEGGGGDDR